MTKPTTYAPPKQSLNKIIVPNPQVEVGDEFRIGYNLNGMDINELVRVTAVMDDGIFFESVDTDA